MDHSSTDKTDNDASSSDVQLRDLKHSGSISSKKTVRVDAMMTAMETMRNDYADVFVGTIEGRYVYIGTAEEFAVFEEVKKYRESHPEEDMNKCFDLFCDRPSGDAIVRACYRSRHPDYVLGFSEEKSHGKYLDLRACYERKLLHVGLIVVHEPSFDPEDVYVLVYTPFQRLMWAAEQRELKVALKDQKNEKEEFKPESIFQRISTMLSFQDRVEPEAAASFRPGKLHEFKGTDSLHPTTGDASYPEVCRYFFRKAHRNLLTWHIITHATIPLKELKELKDQNRLPFRPSSALGINQLENRGIYEYFFPLHDGSPKSKQVHPNLRTVLKKDWALSPFKRQPIDQIREYFGEKIALYFAFIGYYTQWLLFATVAGLIITIYGVANAYAAGYDYLTFSAHIFDNPGIIPWGAFMAVWATVFLEFWKRRTAFLAWQWDTMEFESQEAQRPEWYGTQIRKSPITGKNELHYPDSIRYTKMTVSFIIVFLGVVIVLASVTATIVYRVWAQNSIGQCDISPEVLVTCNPQNNLTNFLYSHPTTNSGINCTYLVNGNVFADCFGYPTPIQCENAGNVSSVSQQDAPLCTWHTSTNPSTPSFCVPACSSYQTKNLCDSTSFKPGYPVRPNYCVWGDKYYVSTITTALINLLTINILKYTFLGITEVLTDWENHRTDTEYEDALIVKSFFFNFLNSYTSLFYIAFFKGNLKDASLFGRVDFHDQCLYGGCMTELLIQLVIVFVGQQFIVKITDVLIPWLKEQLRKKLDEREKQKLMKDYQDLLEREKQHHILDKAIDPENDMSKPPQWTKDAKLEEHFTLFDDYNWMAIQFGYITMFAVSFPLAPLCGLLNNVVEIRTDSYRLLTRFQRPPAREAQDIGTWQQVLEVVGLLAVITNAFIIAFSSIWVTEMLTSSWATNADPIVQAQQLLAGRLIIVIVFEHVIFGLKVIIALMIPDIPGPVQMAVQREQYLARVALEGDDESDPFNYDDDDVEDLFHQLLNAADADSSNSKKCCCP